MRKLRTLLAAALFTLPVVALSASQLSTGKSDVVGVQSSVSSDTCCYVYWQGHWWCLPC